MDPMFCTRSKSPGENAAKRLKSARERNGP